MDKDLQQDEMLIDDAIKSHNAGVAIIADAEARGVYCNFAQAMANSMISMGFELMGKRP